MWRKQKKRQFKGNKHSQKTFWVQKIQAVGKVTSTLVSAANVNIGSVDMKTH